MAANSTVFATNLQALRKQRGVTQEQLAHYLGVSPQAVSKWENGSYPEGDLLPRISEYFGVSISYLYGQEAQAVSLEQRILDTMQDILEKHRQEGKEGNAHPEYLDQMLDIAWAFQIGAWPNNRTYYERGVPDENTRTASAIYDDSGFSFFNLNKEREFYTIVREPEGGFAKYLKVTEELRAFFRILGEPGALEVLFYMMSLNHTEYVTCSTIANSTGVTEARIQELIEEIKIFENHCNSCFTCVDVVHNDTVEQAYSINGSICMFISLLLNSDVIIRPPHGYQMQVGMRGKSWFDRNEVKEHMTRGKENGKV